MDDITSYSIKQVLGFEVGSLPMRYLDLSLMSTRLFHQDCMPLIDKLKTRILSWKDRDLYFARRVLLIKAVLNSMLIHVLCFLRRPSTN